MLVSAVVLVGFSGSGATPLLAGTEIEWLTPQSEYRPTEYLQCWLRFWFNDEKRLMAAKKFQKSRIEFLEKVWRCDNDLKVEGFNIYDVSLQRGLENYKSRIDLVDSTMLLLQAEAQWTKYLYKYSASTLRMAAFVRNYEGDQTNAFLNHGNYLAYGLWATTLWVLGIPHGFAVMHGKTRRGALVFDVADLIKDALVLPWAFICAKEKCTTQEFRQQCLQKFTQHRAMDFMFNIVKEVSLNYGAVP